MAAYESLAVGILLAVAVLLLLAVARAPEQLLGVRGGGALLALALVVLPVLVGAGALSHNLSSSTHTRFRLSCHEMQPHGQSLFVDDDEVLAAQHFQNRRVPREAACYTCHKNYAMFGDVTTKLNGLKHVWVHYLGAIPEPAKIELYEPYPNQNCLHCHLGARSFEDSKHHQSAEKPLAAMLSGAVSCVSSGCHDVAHAVGGLDTVDFWQLPSERSRDVGVTLAPPKKKEVEIQW